MARYRLHESVQIRLKMNCILAIPCLFQIMRIPSPLFQGGFVGFGIRFRPTPGCRKGVAFEFVLKEQPSTLREEHGDPRKAGEFRLWN